jgi:predicted nucleotidyltransferase
MEFKFSQKRISIDKEMSHLDKFVFKFCNFLNKEKIRYVIVSGYISIVFGRSRNTEDIDILVEKINFDKFEKLKQN